MQSLPGEDPPEHEVPYLESAGADVAAVVSPECLLVPCRSQRGFPMILLPQHEVHSLHAVLLHHIKWQDPCGMTPDLVRGNGFSSIN